MARTFPRSMRSESSSVLNIVVAGITTMPNFIAASIDSHIAGTLPSKIRRWSPRLRPRLRKYLAIWFDRPRNPLKLTV